MPPRGKKGSASAKRAKGPSPRTRRSVAEPVVPIEATEEIAVPESEVPLSTVEEEKAPEPEPTPEPESNDAVEEEKQVPEPEPMPEPASNDAVEEEKQVPEPEVLTSTVEVKQDPEAEVLPCDVMVEETVEEVRSSPAVVEMEDFAVEEDTSVLESEALLDSRDHGLEVVESERDGEMPKEDEEIADGANEMEDVQMDQEQGIEQESVEETVVEDKNIGGGDDDAIAGAGESDGNDVAIAGADEGDVNDVAIDGADEGDGNDVAFAGADEGDGNDVAGADEGDDNLEEVAKSESDDDDEDEEEDHSLYMHAPMSDKKKQKDFEIFIGGLDKEAVEEDLIKVFGAYGEIQSARIVKHPTTQKSKGFGFIRYATIEQAKKVLAELKDGTEVRGKRVGISASQDNDTIYLGNVCKTWTKDNVITALKGYGIEQIDEIFLPEDPKNEGKIKGYAFVEFSTHSDAMAAFQRLRKPDAVFGRDRSAKVAFAPSSMHPSEEILSQVKTVFVEGLPESWDEQKVTEHCKQYGEIEKVQLSRYFTNARRRDFGFIAFTSRESAIACVDGINNAQLGEGEVKVKANLAKPQNKGRLAKQGARGGFKIKDGENTEGGGSNAKGNAKFKRAVGKGNVHSQVKPGRGGKPSRPQGRPQGQFTGGQGSAPFQYHQKRDQPFKGGKRNDRFIDNTRPSKKARDNRNFSNMRGRPSGRPSGNRNNPHFGKSKKNFNNRPAPYRNSYPPVHGAATTSYQGGAYGAVSGSKRPYSDMAPHAGYVEPAGKQARGAYGYGQGSAGGYAVQGTSVAAGYAGGSIPPSSQVPGYSGYAGYEAGYGYPNNAAYPPPNNAAYPPPDNAGYPPQSNVAYPPHGAYY